MQTHLGYADFGDVIDAVDGLDADATSLEEAPSRMEVLPKLAAAGFVRGIGPGAYATSTALGRRPPMRSRRSSGGRVGASGQAVGQRGLRAEDTVL